MVKYENQPQNWLKKTQNSFKLPTQHEQRKRHNDTKHNLASYSRYFLFLFLVSASIFSCVGTLKTHFFFSLRMTRRKTENDYRRLIQCSRWCRRVKKWLGDFVEVVFRSFRAVNWSSQNKLNEIIEVIVRDLRDILIIYMLKVSNLAPKFVINWCFTWFIDTRISCVKHRPANLFIDRSCFPTFI